MKAQQCPEVSAPQNKSHRLLAPCHWGVFLTTSETSAKDTLHTLPPPQGTCHSGSGVFKMFLPPPSDIPSQQFFSPAKHGQGQALFSPPESLDGRHQQWRRDQTLSRSLVPEPVLCMDESPAISSWYCSTSHTSSGFFPDSKVTFHVPRPSLQRQGSVRSGLQPCLPPDL